jgi:glycosyltransferase involved in cell wall biosynthesis
MKVVMLCDFFNESLEYQENLLVRYYVKHEHMVTVITSTFDSVFDYYSDVHDNRVPGRAYMHGGAKIIKLRYRYNFLNRLRAFTSIERILEEERPDLIFVHDIIPNVLEAIRYKEKNPDCRMILDYHADYSNSGRNWFSIRILHGIVRKWFLDRAREHTSRIFPIVPGGATFLHEVYGVPHSEMEVLPLGADTDLGRLVSELGEGLALRKTLGISENDVVIFTGGKLAPAKKTELLVEAFKNLNAPNVHLFVIGEASQGDRRYAAELLALAKDAPNVHFTGWLPSRKIYSFLDMADLAVFPASQSIIWQQAISMGLPLVVGNSGHQDISYLNKYGNIVMLESHEINALRIQEVISELVGDDSRRVQMADGARRVTAELLSWDSLIARTLQWNISRSG